MELNIGHVFAALAYDLNGYTTRTNSMCGTKFDLPYLRGKGLSSSGSIHSIRKFEGLYAQMGAYVHAGYDFDGYVGIKGAARYDYTMRFDNKPMLLPSGEAFIDFRKIFLPQSRVLSALKVTGGYGVAGRVSSDKGRA